MQICQRRQPGSGLPWGGLLPPFKFPLNTELLAEDRNFLLLRPSVLGKETLPPNTPPIPVPNQVWGLAKIYCHQKPESCYLMKEFTQFIQKPLDPGPQHPTPLWRRMTAISVREMDSLMPEA